MEPNKHELNYKELVDNYINIKDWRVKENSTVSYSVGGLILSNSGSVIANYWLSNVYDQEIANAHRSSAIHLHDLSMLTGYCAGWSLKQLIGEGLGGAVGKITSTPASHLSTLCNQMVNFIGILQNEWAGAQAFSSFDTYLAPFVKVDNLTQKEIKQCVQSFVFGINTPSRWGTQAPFCNITLDWAVPKDLANLPAVVGGKEQDFTPSQIPGLFCYTLFFERSQPLKCKLFWLPDMRHKNKESLRSGLINPFLSGFIVSTKGILNW
jgi:ribonucleoside-triphosphate reductase